MQIPARWQGRRQGEFPAREAAGRLYSRSDGKECRSVALTRAVSKGAPSSTRAGPPGRAGYPRKILVWLRISSGDRYICERIIASGGTALTSVQERADGPRQNTWRFERNAGIIL